ncbi:uncharacterized protein ACIBXB_019977 [Morphnus guianensis]
MGKCPQVGVGLGVDACAAALVCILHREVLLPSGFAHVEDVGRREHACVRAHACVGACLCSRARLHTGPRVCPRRLPAVAHRRQRVRARAGRGGRVCWATRTHMSGVALTCSRAHFTSPAASARRAPAPRRCRGMTHGLAEEAVTQSWIPASPHPPGRPAIAATWSLRDPSRGRHGGTRPGAGCWGSPSGCWGHVPLRGSAGSLRGRGGPSGAREEAAPGARGGNAHALTPARAGPWVQARARFPGVFWVVPAVRSPG